MPTEVLNTIQSLLNDLLQNNVFVSALPWALGLIFLISFLYILKAIFTAKGRQSKAFQKTVLLIKVPKEKKGDRPDSTGADDTINHVREEIAVSETLFSAIAGLKKEKGIMAWLRGRNDHVAFEIVVKDSKISFYIIVPDKIRGFVEQQVHAQYPHAEITQEPDYNPFKPQSHIVGAYLWLKHKSAFPIKTYKKLDSDPLVALLNPLSKINEDEGAIIQFIVRPASNHWRKEGVHMIRDIKKGEKFEKVANQNQFLKTLGGWTKYAFPKKKPSGDQMMEPKYQLTQMEEDMVKNMEEKISRGGVETTMRLISSANSKEKAILNLENIINAFSQYNLYRYGNTLGAVVPRRPNHLIRDYIYRSMKENHYMVFNTEEMASFWHLPIPSTETPNINWLGARKAPPPTNMPREGITLGRSVYRGEESIVKMKREDRRRHLYTIGKSGSGKSVFIQNLAVQDVINGEGVCVIDPHGDFVDYVLQHVPKERAEDVIYFNRPM